MNIPLKKTGYSQHYRKQWEKEPLFQKWLRPVVGNDSKAMCLYCKTEFTAKLYELKRHSESRKHIEKCKPFLTGQSTISVEKVKSQGDVKTNAEALLSLFIAEHTAFSQVDHLSQLCAKAFPDSKAACSLQLHRTKCGEIIKNVLGPHFKSALKEDIGDSCYSIEIDESTDISVHKYLGIVIRYFSYSMKKMITTFLAIAELETADAIGIVNALVKTIHDYGLNIQKMVGLGTDNASVMVGINNGVYKILKEEHGIPHLILVRCVCHSLQLAVSHASEETIPRNIEFMLRETFNWFCLSPERRRQYANMYATINCGKQPLKILKRCATRWLSIEPAVQRILNQWDELKLLFEISKSKNNCYTAEMLFQMYSDPSNKVYLIYIKTILTQVQCSLKAFEGQNSDPTKLLQSLVKLLHGLCDLIVIPGRRHSINIFEDNIANYLDPTPYLGYNFERSIETFSTCDKEVVRKRCIDFTVKLTKELQQRLPDNVKTLQNMSIMSVDHVLKPEKSLEIIKLAEHFGLSGDTIEKVIFQWKNIHVNKWENTNDTVNFWHEVSQVRDAANENPFKELCLLAFTILVLPHSNADVERLFSSMNVIKNKLRNRMNVNTLNAVLQIRFGLIKFNQTCFNYIIPEHLFKNIGSKDKYKFTLNKTARDEVQPSTSTSSATNIENLCDDLSESSDDDCDIVL